MRRALAVASFALFPASAAAAELVKVATARTISDAGLYMAAFQGWFRDEGIELDLIGFDSSTKMIAPLDRKSTRLNSSHSS